MRGGHAGGGPAAQAHAGPDGANEGDPGEQAGAGVVPLNHVALTVSDRDRSAAFYAEHFGLDRTLHEDEHLLILSAARERFRTAGVEECEWQDDGTFVRVQVFDPDGYRAEAYAF